MKSKKIIKCLVATLAVVLLAACHKNAEDNLIPVLSGDKWGYVDRKGTFVVNPQFDDAHCFHNGLAQVKSNQKIGYIDAKGQYVIKPEYAEGSDFSEGLAFVVTENSYPTCINTRGEVIFVLKQQCTVYPFNDGLARYCTDENKFGFVNTKGELAIPARFEYAGNFYEGLAAVCMFVGNEERYGYIDKNGNMAINCQFSDADEFHEGLAVVGNGKMRGFINTKGEYMINPQFDDVECFSESMAVFDNGKMHGYIDKKGKYAINPQFDEAGDFHEGLAAVGNGSMFGYVDTKGNYVVNPQFDYACDFHNGIAAVKSNNKWGLIDTKGKYVVNPQFDNIRHFHDVTDYVKSTYYDANAFVELLLGGENSPGCVMINSLKEGTTLKQVAENKHFSSAEVSNRTTLRYFPSSEWNFEGNIRLYGVDFKFSDDVYETYYDYYYYSSSKSFQWGAKLAYAVASFRLGGNANGKGAALVKAVFNKLRNMAAVADERAFDNGVCGYLTDKKCGVIVNYEDDYFYFSTVTIGKNEFDKLAKNIMENKRMDSDDIGIMVDADIDVPEVTEVIY